MKPCGRLLGLIALAGFAVVTGFTLQSALAQTVDPQSLVGQWAGTWAMANEPGVQGTHNMTISKVGGNQVYGHVDRIGFGRAVATAHFDFVGTLDGDRLTFAGPAHTVELTVSGTNMRGTGSKAFALLLRWQRASDLGDSQR